MAERIDFPNERLRFARKQAGFRSAADAARFFKVRYPTYAGHENGSRDFRENAEFYARKLNVSFEWLWTGHGPRERASSVSDEIADLPPDVQRIIREFIEFQRSRL